MFSFNSQLQTIDAVKEQLSEKAKIMGGNAIVNFQYGQKSSGWFKSFLFESDDNIKWYGVGMVAIISDDRIKEIKGKKN